MDDTPPQVLARLAAAVRPRSATIPAAVGPDGGLTEEARRALRLPPGSNQSPHRYGRVVARYAPPAPPFKSRGSS